MSGEEDVDQIVDVEEYARDGKPVPHGRSYRIRIDKQHYEVTRSAMTGSEILQLAGKDSTRYRLDQKLRGGQTKKVEPDDVVDFTTPGLERFMTLPLDQTEGGDALKPRRDFRLPEDDEEHLDARGLIWETVNEGGALWLLLRDFPIPSGYGVTTALLAIRIAPNYPTAPLDMCYFHPALALKSGRPLRQTQAVQQIIGKQFQRWSRHRSGANPWRVGVDDVATHLGLIEEWLAREVTDVAA